MFKKKQRATDSECIDKTTDPMGLKYRGTINRLKSGQTCQAWTSDTPNLSGYPVSRYTKAFISGVGVSLKLSGTRTEKN